MVKTWESFKATYGGIEANEDAECSAVDAASGIGDDPQVVRPRRAHMIFRPTVEASNEVQASTSFYEWRLDLIILSYLMITMPSFPEQG